MSLFKKSNRKFRQRVAHDDDSDEDKHHVIKDDEKLPKSLDNNSITKKFITTVIDGEVNENINAKTKALNVNRTHPKLSFQDDDDEENGDTFKVKKSSYSRRMTRERDKQKKRKDEPKNVEKIKEENKEKDNDELKVVWVKTEPKEEPKENSRIFAGDQIISDEDSDEEQCVQFDTNETRDESFHEFRGSLQRGVIPDAKTIYALKKQRQMARDITEFIPLDDDEKYDDTASRLIRDDDNDRSDDDDDEDDDRISFAVNKDAIESEKTKEAFLLSQEDDDLKEDSDDEIDRWEYEQIKKGVGMPLNQLFLNDHGTSLSITGQNFFNKSECALNMDIDPPVKTKISVVPSSVLSKSKINVTFDDIRKRLNAQLNFINESLEDHQRQLDNVNNSLCAIKMRMSLS